MAVGLWAPVALSEILEQSVDPVRVDESADYKQVTVRIRGRGLALRGVQPGYKIATKRQFRIATDQLLVSKIDARNGAFGVVPDDLDDAIVTQDFPVFSIDRDRVLPEFIGLVVGRADFWDECLLASEGSTNRVRLNLGEFLQLEIELPSLSEQTEIVRASQTADETALLTEEEAATARGLLRSAQSSMIAVPGAPERRIGDFTSVVAGGTPSRQRPEFFGGDVAWVKSGDIVFRDLHETTETITEVGVRNSSAKLLPAGTVVVAMYGQGATRGRSAVLRVPMTTNQACAGILPSDHHCERFLFHWLWSQYEELREEYDGTSQPNLNKGLIENVVLPLPSLDEQRGIAEELDAIEHVAQRAGRGAEAARELRSSLVDALLTGACRVAKSSPTAGRSG